MRFPKLPKFKLPKWKFRITLPKLFSRPDSRKSFYHVWKKFLGQIPRESRSVVNSYQHFIILGDSKCGKTELILGLTEQSQDLYSFDTSYTEDPDIQFYLGPNQVIQEMSFASLEDKSIKGRGKTIKLWKKLYARRDPIIIIAFDCLSADQANLRDRNRLAQLIAGKISLLSEIIKKPVKVRVALTNLDKIPGYLEFARFLKKENLTFEIPLTADFQSNWLESSTKKFFEEHITLMLTSSSNKDFLKLISFSKEMPGYFQAIEEFLRVLVSRVSFENCIELDTLSFTSNQESNSSFIPFQWTRDPSSEIFFRYPLLKHQLASVAILVLLVIPLAHQYLKEKKQLELSQGIIEHLDLYHYHKYHTNLIPTYVASYRYDTPKWVAYLTPEFFGKKLDDTRHKLAERIRKHYLEREYHRAVLDNQAEFKCLYFNALMYASNSNNLGKYFLENSAVIAPALNVDEDILKAYILSCKRPCGKIDAVNFNQVNPFLPFTSFYPWMNFFKKINDISNQQIYVEQNFDEIVKDTQKLMFAVERIKDDPHPSQIANLFIEEGSEEGNKENVQVISWIGYNLDVLSSFLQFMEQTSNLPLDSEVMNIAQFFTKIKFMSSLTDRENKTYNFAVKDQLFSFQTKIWIDLVIAHNVERAIQKYIALNNDSGGDVFFKNTNEITSQTPVLSSTFPYFASDVQIPGRYTVYEYENKVKTTTEKLSHWIDSLTINPEDKKRFISFLRNEILSYVKAYQGYYQQYFDSCEIENVSFDNLKQTLVSITQDSSNFHDFLKHVSDQTSGFSQPVITLRNMRDLNQFDFLNTILTVDNGQAPYEKYQQVIAQLLNDLETSTSNSENSPGELQLTNLAMIASNILQDNPQSYMRKIKDCLTDIGVPNRFQAVFLKPIFQLYRLGLPDLKHCIEYEWSNRFETHIDRVFAKFPFNPDATEILSYTELEHTLHPTSNFYRKMQDVMSTCCTKSNGIWNPLDRLDLQLDETILTKLNQIERVANLLWDIEGNPRPIHLSFQLVPIQNGADDNPVVVQTYLVVGDEVVRNLNQTPTTQTLSIDWWKGDQCTVGIELMNKYTNTSSHQIGPQAQGPWSFFELLRNAHADHSELTWKIASNANGQNYPVSVKFEKNPKWLLNQNIRTIGNVTKAIPSSFNRFDNSVGF